MMIRIACPRCGETDDKKNGNAHPGKPNDRCRRCGREFIQAVAREPVSQAQRDIIQQWLLERLSLRGICRVVGMSLGWRLNNLVCLYEGLPEHVPVTLEHANDSVFIQRIDVEAEELLSVVSNKNNKQWLWLAVAIKT